MITSNINLESLLNISFSTFNAAEKEAFDRRLFKIQCHKNTNPTANKIDSYN